MTQEDPNTPGLTEEESELEKLRKVNASLLQEMNNLSNRVSNIDSTIQDARKPKWEPPTKEEYEADPIGSLTKVVQAQIAPLQGFILETRAANALNTVKNQIKSQYSDLALFEGIWEQLMGNAAQINTQTGMAAYYTAKGLFISNGGKLGGNDPKNDPPKKEDSKPPFQRPSGNSNLNNIDQNGVKLRQLNEMEERLRKENNMTHAEWLFAGGEISKEDYIKASAK